jgi:glyoxylase-like metal-dependent hydrolase (beta-lactamase superfamily II)
MDRLLLCIGCWLAGAACAATDDAAVHAGAPFPIAEQVYVLTGEFAPGQQPDGNSVLLQGNSGWIVFDTGRHADHTLRIQDFVRSRGGHIDSIVNSHWHLDHIGGNARIRIKNPAVRVYASPAIEQAMGSWLANYREQLQQMLASPGVSAADKTSYRGEIALIDNGAKLYPDVHLTSTRNWRISDRPVRLGLETDAVTAGDVWLYDRRSRVLAAGDLVTLPVPFLDTACAQRWSEALAGLEDLPFERLVPGHGPVLNRQGFSQYRAAFDQLLVCAASERSVAECSDDWLARTAQWVPEKDRERARGMLGYYFEQFLRAPIEQRERYCPHRD